MRIITLNLNGIRSAAKKGVFAWLKQQNADIICVQELKAQQAELLDNALHLEGYRGYFHFAEKKGYSGVGIFTLREPDLVTTGLGWAEADAEGRYIEIHLGDLRVASLYMPSGTSGELRQNIKFEFLKKYADFLHKIKEQRFIICGDWNIAHREIDLKNWRGNQKNSGFLPEERAWLDQLFGSMGFIDAFREVNQEPEQYTWWSNRGQAWAKNVGWRIDYQVLSPGLKGTVKAVHIYKDERFSDHAPLVIDYNI